MAELRGDATARAEIFKQLLETLLGGATSPTQVKSLRAWLDDSRPDDLVRAVDQAVAAGHNLARLKPAVSKLINLMHDSLAKHRLQASLDDPLFASLLAENAGLLDWLANGKSLTQAFNRGLATVEVDGAALRLSSFCSGLAGLESLRRKKENVLFPWFEAHYPEYRCVRLMWDIHDDIRRGLKQLAELLDTWLTVPATDGRRLGAAAINATLGKLYFDINTNIFREECALFPIMAGLMAPATKQTLFTESADYGWSFLNRTAAAEFERLALDDRQRSDSLPTATAHETFGAATGTTGESAVAAIASGLVGRTGHLPPEILGALFATIHLDMTWVDQDDKVRWFSDSPKRIFPRSPAIIGRDVRNCHPGSSVDRVVAILNSFRVGGKDREAFWIELGGRFIHIEYFALRSPDGRYLGTLEASEDLTDKRALRGQKRLAEAMP